jgi:tetratricopeptide (TPR) repeat protein
LAGSERVPNGNEDSQAGWGLTTLGQAGTSNRRTRVRRDLNKKGSGAAGSAPLPRGTIREDSPVSEHHPLLRWQWRDCNAELPKGSFSQGDAPANLPHWPSFLAGAQYVLARAALADTPPRVEEALEHLRQSEQASEGAAAIQWRLMGLEIAALKVRADLTPGGEAAADPLRLLGQERLPKALARLRQDLAVVRPAGEGRPERPALAELSPTDTRGVLDLLRVALLLADEDRILGERVELTLDVCTQFQSAGLRRPRLYLEMSPCLVTLTQAVTEHPAAAADWPRLAARVESLAALAFVPVLRRSRAGEVLSGDRLSLPVLDTLGVVYCAAGQAAEAVQLFEEAAGRYRNEPVVYLHLARSYAALGESAKAQANGEAALSYARARATAVDSPRERARWEQQVVEIRAQLGPSVLH